MWRGKGIGLEEVLIAKRTFRIMPASCVVRKDVRLRTTKKGSLVIVVNKDIGKIP